MSEILIPGPVGRLEGRYQPGARKNAPIALVLHPHPQYGGTMHSKVVYALYRVLADYGFSVLRFNFRGVGKSEGSYDNGDGELSDAAAVLDWLQHKNPFSKSCWITGFSFGAWIAMQLLMRRPEISSFIAISPPINLYDFGFLAPCPASGQIIQGKNDSIVDYHLVENLVEKLSKQKGISIDYHLIEQADHYFTDCLPSLRHYIEGYLNLYLRPVSLGRQIA